jgi:hypothetical protein
MFTCKLEWTPILIWKIHNWRITKSEEPIWGLDWIEGSIQNLNSFRTRTEGSFEISRLELHWQKLVLLVGRGFSSWLLELLILKFEKKQFKNQNWNWNWEPKYFSTLLGSDYIGLWEEFEIIQYLMNPLLEIYVDGLIRRSLQPEAAPKPG